MRPEALADAAFGSMKGGSSEGPPDDLSAPDDAEKPELEAQMSKLLKAIAAKDTKAMADAFEGAKDACESYDDTAESPPEGE